MILRASSAALDVIEEAARRFTGVVAGVASFVQSAGTVAFDAVDDHKVQGWCWGYLLARPDGASMLSPRRRHRPLPTPHPASRLPPVRLHDLRHGTATLALAAGVGAIGFGPHTVVPPCAHVFVLAEPATGARLNRG
jgi:hypothetical protein